LCLPFQSGANRFNAVITGVFIGEHPLALGHPGTLTLLSSSYLRRSGKAVSVRGKSLSAGKVLVADSDNAVRESVTRALKAGGLWSSNSRRRQTRLTSTRAEKV